MIKANEEILGLKDHIAKLEEQLIKMCRVFHAADCICKWCNIVKERAGKGVEDMGFTPAEPPKKKNGWKPEDTPLKSDDTYRQVF